MPTDPVYHSILPSSVVLRLLVVTGLFSAFHCLSLHSDHCPILPSRFPPASHSSPTLCSGAVLQPKLVSRGTDPLCALHAAALTFHQLRAKELNLPRQQTWIVRAETCSCGILKHTTDAFCIGNSKVSTKGVHFLFFYLNCDVLAERISHECISWETSLKLSLPHSQEFRFSAVFFGLERNIFSSSMIEIHVSVQILTAWGFFFQYVRK